MKEEEVTAVGEWEWNGGKSTTQAAPRGIGRNPAAEGDGKEPKRHRKTGRSE
jgi:hypothetical protein